MPKSTIRAARRRLALYETIRVYSYAKPGKASVSAVRRAGVYGRKF